MGETTFASWPSPAAEQRRRSSGATDLVLCDLVLPGSSGHELLNAASADER